VNHRLADTRQDPVKCSGLSGKIHLRNDLLCVNKLAVAVFSIQLPLRRFVITLLYSHFVVFCLFFFVYTSNKHEWMQRSLQLNQKIRPHCHKSRSQSLKLKLYSQTEMSRGPFSVIWPDLTSSWSQENNGNPTRPNPPQPTHDTNFRAWMTWSMNISSISLTL